MSPKRIYADWKQMPGMLKLLMLTTVAAFVGDMWTVSIAGYRLAGIAWLVPMLLGALVIVKTPNRVAFPWRLWLPWLGLLAIHAALLPLAVLDSHVDPLQRTAQLMCPLVIGAAVSIARPTSKTIEAFLSTFTRVVCVLLLMIGIRSGILLTGRLPSWSGLAPEAITVTLLCAFAMTSFLILRQRRYVVLWVVLACVPVVMVTRMPILACLLTLPLALAPLRLWRRLLFSFLVVCIGLGVFYLPTVQEKMFFSASGSVSDVSLLNTDLATSGRNRMWRAMGQEIPDALWVGRGTGAGETFVRNLTSSIAFPHSDWILSLYDYGIVGVTALVASFVLAVRNALMRSRSTENRLIRVLLVGGAASFVPLVIMMVSDNVLVYASFFGNIQFALLGLGYGALARERAKALSVASSPSSSPAHI